MVTPRKRRAGQAETRAGWVFALPWITGLTLFTLIPLLQTFYSAQTKFQIVGAPKWVGAQNYQAMWADAAFWTSTRNSTLVAAISVPLKLILALELALLLNRQTALSGSCRTVFSLPFLMPAVAGSIVFMLLLMLGVGPVNIILTGLGLHPPDWLLAPKAALWALILLSL